MNNLLYDNVYMLKGEGKSAPGLSRSTGAFPVHLDVEPTSRCNFNCTFCDKQPLLKKEQLGDMSFDLYKKIIDEGAREGLGSVQLCYRGEPLLHNDLPNMVAYAKEKGIEQVFFCTNGTLLTPQNNLKLIEAGLDHITISVQGTNAQTFEAERFGAKFSLVLRNISHLLAQRKKADRSVPKIRLQAVWLPELDVDEYAAFWAPYCDEVTVVKYKECGIRERGVKTDWSCPQPWQRMTIEWDGRILPCNNDDIGVFALGNVNDTSIREAWNCEKMKTIRTMHEKGLSHTIEDCDGCPYRTIQSENGGVPG
jgi:radical SAM protein with 4Fe4S-binding SPASM domain